MHLTHTRGVAAGMHSDPPLALSLLLHVLAKAPRQRCCGVPHTRSGSEQRSAWCGLCLVYMWQCACFTRFVQGLLAFSTSYLLFVALLRLLRHTVHIPTSVLAQHRGTVDQRNYC